jgi:hypothetical protein
VTYRFKGKAERPRHPNDREVGYELLPIFEHWWNKAQKADWSRGFMFDDYFRYQPRGGRPRTPYEQIAGAFFGRKFGVNKAKPFWGWHDLKTRRERELATGQWGLDPAYSVSRNLNMPEPFSLDYIYNPYLGIGIGTAASPNGSSSEKRSTDDSDKSPEPVITSVRVSLESEEVSDQGFCEIEGEVDSIVVIQIRKSEVTSKVIDGRPPKKGFQAVLSSPLPSREIWDGVTVDKSDGRGRADLLEWPWEGNGFTAVIRIHDPKSGSDFYRIRLEWKR